MSDSKTPPAGASSQDQLVRQIVVQGLTNDVREALMGARKWLLRIHQRKAELPPGFMDGCDPQPLADEIARLLSPNAVRSTTEAANE